MTKKKDRQKFWWMKIGNFVLEKVKFQKTGGKSETGGKMHHGLRGRWTPLVRFIL